MIGISIGAFLVLATVLGLAIESGAGEGKAQVEKAKGEMKGAVEETKGEMKALKEEAKGNDVNAEME